MPGLSAPARRARRRHGGFTLMELLVVFVVLAMLAALVPVAFERLSEGARYRDAVRAAVSDLRAARQQALLSGGDTRFVVDLAARRFGVEGAAPYTVPEPLQLRAVMAQQESGAGGQQMAIRFLPRGGASGGSLDVLRPSGSGVRLRVDWFSGRVEQEPITP